MFNYGEFKFLVATTPALIEASQRLRYKIYVTECGFEKAEDHPGGRETDSWDDHSIHMAALNGQGDVIGTIRLVLNSSQGLPTLLAASGTYQDKNPASKRIAEISRLTVDSSFRRRFNDGLYGADPAAVDANMEKRQRFIVVLGLFRIVYNVSKKLNIADWFMMCEKRLWHLLKRYQILFNPIGPEMDYHGPRIPYIGKIAEIEEHMLRVNAQMAKEFGAEELPKTLERT